MYFQYTALLALILSRLALAVPASEAEFSPSPKWYLSRFSNFVVFGDSYTDEDRLGYFISHDGGAPPTGTFFGESMSTSDGGRIWARYVIQYTGKTVKKVWTPLLTLYNYAVSGAVCSNNITPRFLGAINANFPALAQYELPAFLADLNTKRNNGSEPYYEPRRTASDTVYAIWDGTNDLGYDAFIEDAQDPGKTITDYTDCIFNQFDTLYQAGGRFFVLMNIAPLNHAPLYANASSGGVGPNQYWPNKGSNLTLYYQRMTEEVATVNEIWQYRIPYEVVLANRYPGANWALYDVHQLMMDIYDNPAGFLNGSAPLNVTGFAHHCNVEGQDCVLSPSPDSFLWYDELHPSQQTDRNIAKNFVEGISGRNKYFTYF